MTELGENGFDYEAYEFRRTLIGRVHRKFEEARALNTALESVESGVSRRFVIEAGKNMYIPSYHARISLIPEARSQAYAGLEKLRLRVPLLERQEFSDADFAEQLFAVPEDFSLDRFMADDVFLEVHKDGQIGDYLLNAEGLVPYQRAADIDGPHEVTMLGNRFTVVSPAMAVHDVAALEETIPLVLLGGYEVELQDNHPRAA